MQKTKQCSIFKIATCETFLKNNKSLSSPPQKKNKNSKTMHHTKNPTNKNLFSHFTSLYQISEPLVQ